MPVQLKDLDLPSTKGSPGKFDFPVRNVVRRNPCRVVGYHASKKMDKLIGWESQIEKMYFELLEVDPEVIKFYAQPVTIKFKGSQYTPDVLVVSKTSEYFVEIKPDSVFRDRKTLKRIRSLQSHFEDFGSELKLITKSELAREPLRHNVEFLGRARRRGASHSVAQLVKKHCEGGELSIAELRTKMGDNFDSWLVLDAIVLGYVELDLNQPIDGNSIIKPSKWSVS